MCIYPVVRLGVLSLFSAIASVAFAVDASKVSSHTTSNAHGAYKDGIDTRWAVVGIISSSTEAKPGEKPQALTGIAVLRNLANNHNYTVSIGESLPTDFNGFVLESVIGRRVTVGNGSQHTVLPFIEAVSTASAAENVEKADDTDLGNSAGRFVDNYYRSLNQASRYRGGDSPSAEIPSDEPAVEARAWSYKDDSARARLEMFKPERSDSSDASDDSNYDSSYNSSYSGEGPSDIVINYDDVPQDDSAAALNDESYRLPAY